MSEPFGPEYAEPPVARADCPNCGCCSARLCQAGRISPQECVGLTANYQETVRGCPCSSDLTAGTMAWRRARIQACRHASEMPFPENVEAVMRAAEAREPLDVDSPEVRALALVHFLAPGTDRADPVLTELGRIYLACRDEPRFQSPLVVKSVDVEQRTAEVLVTAWSDVTAVTVPLDQVQAALGEEIPLERLPGARLMCAANVWADEVEDVVVTSIEVPPPAPVPGPSPSPEARAQVIPPKPDYEPRQAPTPAAGTATGPQVTTLTGRFVRVEGSMVADPRVPHGGAPAGQAVAAGE